MAHDPELHPKWEEGTLAVLETAINRLNLNATVAEVGPGVANPWRLWVLSVGRKGVLFCLVAK